MRNIKEYSGESARKKNFTVAGANYCQLMKRWCALVGKIKTTSQVCWRHHAGE